MPKTPRRSRQHKDQPGFSLDRNAMRAAQNQREQESHEALQRLLAMIAERSKPIEEDDPLTQTLEAIEESRLIALHCHPPQVMAAVAALRLRADILGLIVRKQAVAFGKPQEFGDGEDREAIYARLNERIGSEHTRRFRAMVENMEAVARGEVIEGEAREIEDDEGQD